MLHLEDYAKFMSGLVHILGIFKITRANLYITSTSLLIMQLAKFQADDHPIYQFLRRDLSSINEELGEMTYSVLSNASLKLRDAGAHTAINNSYRLMSTYRDVVKGLKMDLNTPTKQSSHVSIIADPAVSILASFLKTHAYEVSAGGFLPYHDVYKKRNVPWHVRVRKAATYPDMGDLRSAAHTELVAYDACDRLRRTLRKMADVSPHDEDASVDDRSTSCDSD